MFSLLFKFTLMPTLFPMMLSYVSKLSSIFCARAPGEDAGALALPLMLGVPPGISFFFPSCDMQMLARIGRMLKSLEDERKDGYVQRSGRIVVVVRENELCPLRSL